MIQKLKIGELLDFYESPAFKDLPVIPLSKNRVASYINNPRKIDDLPTLYLFYENTRLIGFRSVLSDEIFINGTSIPFGWFSGSWVHPDYRRLGIATQLLNEVMKDWNNRMMFTNYAPSSKALYDKSNSFCLFEARIGLRIYFRVTLAELLEKKHFFFRKSKKVWSIMDAILNGIASPYFWWQKIHFRNHFPDKHFSNSLNESHYTFINQHSDSVFNRTQPEYEWIFKYPWVKTACEERAEYPFSHVAKEFDYFVLTIYNRNNEITGLAIGKIRDGHVTLPYLVVENDAMDIMAKKLLTFMVNRNYNRLTMYHPAMVSYFRRKRGIGIFKKKMVQRYFITQSFLNELPAFEHPILLQDGDGDCIFT